MKSSKHLEYSTPINANSNPRENSVKLMIKHVKLSTFIVILFTVNQMTCTYTGEGGGCFLFVNYHLISHRTTCVDMRLNSTNTLQS